LRPYLKKKSQKRAGGVAEGVGPEFKSQYHTQKNPSLNNEYTLYKNEGQEYKRSGY
jgi:aspartyl aminopeptidase